MLTRRDFLERGYGLGGIALATLLQEQGLLANPTLSGAAHRSYDNFPSRRPVSARRRR